MRFFNSLIKESEFYLLTAKPLNGDVLNVVMSTAPSLIALNMSETPSVMIQLLSKIMMKAPYPVVLLSTKDDDCRDSILKGLEIGAVDILPVPLNAEIKKTQMARMLRSLSLASSIKVEKTSLRYIIDKLSEKSIIQDIPQSEVAIEPKITIPNLIDPNFFRGKGNFKYDAVGVAISTGGPQTLNVFLSKFPQNFPAPIFIVQHIIKGFVVSVAKRLDGVSKIKVKTGETGEMPKGGCVYLAPDGYHMILENWNGKPRICLTQQPSNLLFCPAADVLFSSMAKVYKDKQIAIMMTGMGQDGVVGLKDIKKAGGYSYAQDEASSVVYGMAKVAVQQELIDKILPLEDLPLEVCKILIGK